MNHEIPKYVECIDVDPDKPKLYLFKLNSPATREQIKRMTTMLRKTICDLSPSSKVIIMPQEFDAVTIANYEDFNEIKEDLTI